MCFTHIAVCECRTIATFASTSTHEGMTGEYMVIPKECVKCQCSARIQTTNWIVQAIGVIIVADDTLAGGGIGISIEESTHFGIVISGLEIIQLRLYLVSEAILPILRDFCVP